MKYNELDERVKEINSLFKQTSNHILTAYGTIDDAIDSMRKANALNNFENLSEDDDDDYFDKTESDVVRMLNIISDQLMNLSRATDYLAVIN